SRVHKITLYQKNIKPGQIEISETARPEKFEGMDGSAKCIVNSFDINEVSQHLAQLCDTAIGAEDQASKANQEGIMCWSLYGRDFEFQVGEMSNKNKISEKKATTLIYNEIENQLSILRKKRSQYLSLQLPNISRDTLRKKTQRAVKTCKLFEKIGLDKIKHIKNYSANSISELTNDQIQEIINHGLESRISNSPSLEITPEVSSEDNIIEVSSETKVNIIPINKNSSNESRLPISILPNDPEEKRNLVIHTTLEQFNNLSLKRSNKYSDYYDYSGTCPTCNEEHKGYDVEGRWGDGNYCGEKTYRLYCRNRTFGGIPIVNVKA
ncbi:17015_t:CDS:2, partial [Acaulospora colombiana]